MAVLTHLVGGTDYVGRSAAARKISTEVFAGSIFTELTHSGTAAGTYAQSVTGTVDSATVGVYTLTYTATDDGGAPHTVTHTVYVKQVDGTPTEFLDSTELRDGTDVAVGTKYRTLISNGTATEVSAAYFDETALDPYEVAGAKLFKQA